MATFNHNGIEIRMDEATGQFSAVVGGVLTKAPSLAGMKKKIGDSKAFKSFPILILQNAHESFVIDTVSGIKRKNPRHYGPDHLWYTEGKREAYDVIEATPENKKAIAAYIAMAKEHSKIYERNRELRRKALAAIPTRNAVAEATGKPSK